MDEASPEQIAAAEAALLSARSQLERARVDLERTVIRAPYAGRVLEQSADVGQFVSVGSTLARIYAIDYVEIPVTDLPRARAFFEAMFGWTFQEWGDEYLSFNDGRLDGGLRIARPTQHAGVAVEYFGADLFGQLGLVVDERPAPVGSFAEEPGRVPQVPESADDPSGQFVAMGLGRESKGTAEFGVVGVEDAQRLGEVAGALLQAEPGTLDIRNGQIVDGTGDAPYTGDVAIKDGKVTEFEVTPEDAGLPVHPFADIIGGTPEENAAAFRALLDGAEGAYRDAVLLNAAAALLVAGKVNNLPDGVALARDSIDSGRAKQAVEKLASITSAA
mgnify:CR=1 FL=1